MSNGPDYPHLGTRIGRWLGPLLAILWFATAGAGMPHDARVVLALAIWMAVWWMTEAVPLSVTSLLPLIMLPPFSGLAFGTVAAPYASSSQPAREPSSSHPHKVKDEGRRLR